MKKRLMVVMVLLLPILGMRGQTIKPLSIGDTVPDILLTNIINYPVSKIQLSELQKGKLLILDFWSTWCAVCIKSFPKNQKLQEEFKGKLQFLLSTPQDSLLIAPFLKKQQISLPSLVGSSNMSAYFPHKSVPHVVWIMDGKVFAITDDYYVNSSTIKKVLDRQLSSLTEKKFNSSYNLNEPLLLEGNGGKKNDLLYRSLITAYLDGIGGGGMSTDSLGRYRLRVLNGSAIQLYKFAAARVNYSMTIKNRTINKTSFKDKWDNLNTSNPDDRPHFFCYELIVPKDLSKNAPFLMIDDLNRFFGNRYAIHGELKKVTQKCWVLKKTAFPFSGVAKSSKTESFKEGNTMVLKNYPFKSYFFSLANENEDQSFPFVDSTSITANVDMIVLLNEPDINKTRKQLKSYGLSLTLENCEIEMLLLTDLTKQKKSL